MKIFLIVSLVMTVLMACGTAIGDTAPSPEECIAFNRASAVEERRLSPNSREESRMDSLCDEVMKYWRPTISPSKEALREEFPYVPGSRYYANGGVHYIRVDPVGRRVHLEGGCPEDEISGSLYPWILDEINDMCGGGITVR